MNFSGRKRTGFANPKNKSRGTARNCDETLAAPRPDQHRAITARGHERMGQAAGRVPAMRRASGCRRHACSVVPRLRLHEQWHRRLRLMIVLARRVPLPRKTECSLRQHVEREHLFSINFCCPRDSAFIRVQTCNALNPPTEQTSRRLAVRLSDRRLDSAPSRAPRTPSRSGLGCCKCSPAGIRFAARCTSVCR